MKKIIFKKASDFAGITGHSPSPASRSLPIWYKEIEKFVPGIPKTNGFGQFAFSVKACPPFLDAMISGYFIYTEYDIYVYKKNGSHFFEWKTGGSLISKHEKGQMPESQIPQEYSLDVYKFNNLWQIITPKGYSCFFYHPSNRLDLPFYTLSGIVETDTYKNVINFPFFIKNSFEGIIPAGTPIVQIFPFNRNSWFTKIEEMDEKELKKQQALLDHKIINSYKRQWWQRKVYK